MKRLASARCSRVKKACPKLRQAPLAAAASFLSPESFLLLVDQLRWATTANLGGGNKKNPTTSLGMHRGVAGRIPFGEEVWATAPHPT